MDMSEYGPFAGILAVAAALVAAFSLLLVKALGRMARWTWLIDDSPPFLVTAGARALAVALIALTYVFINKSNYPAFVIAAVIFGALTFWLIGRFDRLRKVHIFKVPVVQKDGVQAVDGKGNALFKNVVIGTEEEMNREAKAAFARARRDRGGLSVTDFMSGYGGSVTNNPGAIWTRRQLADISNRLTVTLMGVILCGVMALYLSASVIAVTNAAPWMQ